MTALAEIVPGVQPYLAVAIAVFLRVGAALAVLPAFGERSVPQRIRLVAAIAFTVIVLPAAAPHFPEEPLGGRAYLTEPLTGLAFGIMIRLTVHALQIAGTVAAQSTSLSQMFGNAGTDPMPAIGHVLVVGGLALAVMADLHVRAAQAMILTYDIVPPGRLIPSGDLAELGIARIGEAFALGLALAAPFMIAAFLYNLALGVINRAMPQLMVTFIGAPAITAAGLILLALAAPLMLQVWLGALESALEQPFGMPR
ncbi:flagellar biosynthetic protein FliR [Roseicyclus sp. F158]|uniref:Flagellar biosynthetic protein FliR n=1 Tax=Tropicimonas omnivorans TaxID=3075590 RepID=A0ABU3DD92_9RHOB|nr:flagellar biosynthetic protein FliR [Roseicyclus sp. F158]MDT0681682.1 flagellar biosynthetic protein FliR [Roseicyclus sp. F158]